VYYICRSLSVSWNTVCSSARLWLLPDSDLRAQYAGRDPVLGLVLDQRWRTLNHEIHRPTDRVDHDHSVDGRQLVDATRVVHQSYRRLDVDVFTVRVRRSARVRRRQRPSSASRPAHPALDAAASVRRAECAAAAAAYAAQGPREPVWPGLHSRQRIHCIIYTGPTPGGA